MPPSLVAAVLLMMGVLLVLVSALAGALWWRARSVPALRALHLARELAERQKALEVLIGRLEALNERGRSPRRGPLALAATAGQEELDQEPAGVVRRVDAGERSAVAGPTLISVPALGGLPVESASAATELQERFGPIWALAESGLGASVIARETGQPIGQVELVLGLRRQLAAAEGRRPDA